MAGLPQTKTVTYEEWLNMPEVEYGREEVVNGEIRIMPPNKFPHALIASNLVMAFRSRLDAAKYYVLPGSLGLVIRKEPLTCRDPDLALFERATVVQVEGYFHSPPQLTVEVLSPIQSRRGIEEKLRDYESIGVPEVWLVSPEALTVEILLLEEGRLRRSAILADGVLKPKNLPGVEIPVSEIWLD